MPIDADVARDHDELAIETAEHMDTRPAFVPDDYRHHLQGCGMSTSEQDELLRALWAIMCGFVDLGWSVDAVSLVLGTNSPSSADEANLLNDNERSAQPRHGAR